MHAVYLKNRLPHQAINDTPYQIYTGTRPSAKHLQIFGCPVVVKNPGKGPAKLDVHIGAGHFLGYTATDKNIYYIDETTKRIKMATHCTFDEAGITVPPAEPSLAFKALQQTGMGTQTEPNDALHMDIHISEMNPHVFAVKLLSEHATVPVWATDGTAG
jgi:hypothetical protein